MSATENYLNLSCFNCQRQVPDEARKCATCHETHCESCMSPNTAVCFKHDGVGGAYAHQRNLAAKEKL